MKGYSDQSRAVGIFWLVDGVLVAAGCPVEAASPYGDCLTYDGGHADHWERWQQAGARWIKDHDLPPVILMSEYDDHPRGRVVKAAEGFVIYADRRLQNSKNIKLICGHFGLDQGKVTVKNDAHYRRDENSA